jgi:ribosome biogenesis protein ENP2
MLLAWDVTDVAALVLTRPLQLLSDDWTKSLHLQTDRTLELHAQGGHHTRLRIPKFGRALGYHFPTATALVGARGREVYRLNLDQGRFMEPFVLGEGSSSGVVTGCNAVDVNPAHGLISLGTEGTGVVELWDPRLRSRAGSLGITVPSVLNASLQSAKRRLPGVLTGQEDEAALGAALEGLSVSALSSAEDGLNLAVGTSTGHVLLYDLRMSKPYAEKDQGFGLPIKSLSWPGDRGAATSRSARTEAHDAVLSADSKVIKVWSKEQPEENIVSITPGPSLGDLNCVHHIPGSGLIVSTVEGTRCGAWYVPALGPAPAWCSFLDTLTDEIDDEQTGSKKGVYEDFKFIDKAELELYVCWVTFLLQRLTLTSTACK